MKWIECSCVIYFIMPVSHFFINHIVPLLSNFLKLKLPSANMCSLEKWSRFSFRYVNFNVHMDLLNIFSSLWELISFGALALPGRTCLFCLTPELDSVLAILAKSCLGAVLCQMWVWKNGIPFILSLYWSFSHPYI